jgi:site-specific DNA-methyltransferase (adenine-specific)
MTTATIDDDFTLTADAVGIRSNGLLGGEEWRVECGDSLELMATMQAGSVDAVVTDPPYMIGAISTGDAKSKAGSWVDLMNASFWYRAWMAEAWRVLKDGGYMVIFLNWRTIPMLMKACADAKIQTSSLAVWDKEWIGPAGPAQLRPTYEMILFCAKGSAKIDNRSRSDVFRHKWMAGHSAQSGHPAQKPVPLLKEIVELVTKPGQTVLDCFMGSGTTGIAAIQAGRRFVGYEGDEEHFKEAKERISNAADPMRAFISPPNRLIE